MQYAQGTDTYVNMWWPVLQSLARITLYNNIDNQLDATITAY